MGQVPQWCDRHWQPVRASMRGPLPVNGLMATVEMTARWLEQLGDETPAPTDVAALDRLRLRDSPLCCRVGDEAMGEITGRCVLPERYRHLEPRVGHVLHMKEAANAGGQLN